VGEAITLFVSVLCFAVAMLGAEKQTTSD